MRFTTICKLCALPIAAISILCGCVAQRQNLTLNEYISMRWMEISPTDFAIPVETPYDGDANLREKYCDGYRNGLKVGIVALRTDTWQTGDIVSEEGEASAYADGWVAAGAMLTAINDQIIKDYDGPSGKWEGGKWVAQKEGAH